MTFGRRLPAIVLVAVLALLPLEAWYRVVRPSVVVTNAVPGLRDIDWAATIAPDGRLAIRIDYDLAPGEREIDIRLPPGARLLEVDGVPQRTRIGRYAELTVNGPTTVTYELPGAVTRHADGAVLRVFGIRDGSIDGDRAMYPCPVCYLGSPGYGNVPLHGAIAATELAEVRLAIGPIDQLQAEIGPGAAVAEDLLRFVGAIETLAAPSLVALIPAAAVPDAPLRDGSAATEYESARRDLAAAGTPTSEPATRAGVSQIAAALVLTLLLAALVGWIVWQFRRAVRLDESVDDPSASEAAGSSHDPPSSLEPALAGLVVGRSGPGRRSIAAGTLLALAHRGVIRIEGVDSQRFVLTLPAGARGSSPSEEAVLAALRPQGNLTATATLNGPPLWGPNSAVVARRVRRVALHGAVRARLVRHTLSALVLVPFSVAMGLVAVIASGGRSWTGWLAVVGGPVLAVAATILTGWSLTRAGRTERDRWLGHARWLRQNSAIEDVGAPGVAVWGEVLPHAAAIGAAPTAADALSPGA